MTEFDKKIDIEYRNLKLLNVDYNNMICRHMFLSESLFNIQKFKVLLQYFRNINHTEDIDVIFSKILVLYNEIILTENEIAALKDLYMLFQKDIEICLKLRKFDNIILNYQPNDDLKINIEDRQYLITLYALSVYFFIKDTRNAYELYENLLNGWAFENVIFNYIKENCDKYVKFNGGDRDRNLNFFSFSAIPDLIVNNHYVELQVGNNLFFKANKLKSNITKKSKILFYLKNEKLFYVFNTDELESILNSKEIICYGKSGRNFNKEDYKFTNLEEAIVKLV